MKNINFAIKEMWELYSLQFILDEFKKYNFKWNIYIVPFNSDFSCISIEKYFEQYSNVSLIFNNNHLIWKNCLGFESDISNRFPDITPLINIYELNTCIDFKRYIIGNQAKFDIIVTNVKINDKKPEREYNKEMWKVLWKLPYSVAIVPRHPFPKNFLEDIIIPKNITIFNKIGIVRELCAKANLTIMWLIFSDCNWETEHNPFEATINSNAITSSVLNVELHYQDLYDNFWLMHKLDNFYQIPNIVDDLINDKNIFKKLQNKEKWLESNKNAVLSKILTILKNN